MGLLTTFAAAAESYSGAHRGGNTLTYNTWKRRIILTRTRAAGAISVRSYSACI